jgi:glutamate-1-semialdehyde 2,1-aminomutase
MTTSSTAHTIHGSAEELDRAARFIGGGVASGLRRALQPQPLSFDHGSGSHLTDVDGNDYIDYVLGWGPAILGHNHPAVTQAVQHQLHKGQVFGAIHTGERRAAERLLDCLPAFERVLFSNTGTEAVQGALRLARAATGKNLVVKCAGAYHGWHDTMLLSYHGHPGGHRPVANSLGQNPRSLDDVLVIEFNDPATLSDVFSRHGQDIAAVIIDPIMSNGGVIAPTAEFLHALREECNQAGALLIFDEVITGFRIALGGAVELYGVVPDLAIYAKAMGNGFPISAIAGRADVIDLVTKGVVHAGTYNGNAAATAATIATLDTLAEPGTYDTLRATAKTLATGLQEIFRGQGINVNVHHLGPIVQLLFADTNPTTADRFDSTDWSTWDRWTRALSAHGLFLLPHGRLFLSAAHTPADIQATLQAFKAINLEEPTP